MGRVLLTMFMLCGLALASSPVNDANQLYRHCDYQGVIQLLLPIENKDGRIWALIGQAYFMSSEYKKAIDAFENATNADPKNSEFLHWLGKSWGRRAESASLITAAAYASKARLYFERSVMMDTANKDALGDLFEYYLEAPGFLGGGLNRAEALVRRIEALDEAEGHYARAQLADRRKEFDQAEQQLRRALEIAPRQVGRALDLAKYLSKLGRVQESENAFAHAETITPGNPRILYERAETYIREKRNLAEARELLKRYINMPLTPDDPPRSSAEQLLRRAGA